MKRFITTGIAAAMVVLLASCAQPTTGTTAEGSGESQGTQQHELANDDALVIGTSGVQPAAAGNASPREGLLGAAQAQDLVLERLDNPANAEFVEFELDDRNDRDAEYEGKVKVGNDVYEFEMDAYTGRIKEWERERPRVQVTTPPSTTKTEKDTQPVSQPSTQASSKREYIGADRAKEIALAKVPGATADHIRDFEFDREDRDGDDRPEYEGEIRYNGYEYEFEIDAYTGVITEWEVERERTPQVQAPTTTAATQAPTTTRAPTTTKAPVTTQAARERISRDRAIEIALAKVPGASRTHIDDVEWDDGKWEIEIEYDGYEYEVDVHGYTGAIVDFEKERDSDVPRVQAPVTQAPTTTKAATPAPTTTKAPATTQAARERISRDRAIEIALAEVPGATRSHIDDVEYDDGKWEIEIEYDGYEYEVDIHGYTGAVVDFEKERDDDVPRVNNQAPTQTARERISRDRAIEIALAKVPGATRSHIDDVEWDDGKWEIEIEYGNYEYEIEIHGYTGDIVDFDEEYDD